MSAYLKSDLVLGRHEGVTLQMAGQWLLLDVQGLGLRLAWDLQVVASRVCLY